MLPSVFLPGLVGLLLVALYWFNRAVGDWSTTGLIQASCAALAASLTTALLTGALIYRGSRGAEPPCTKATEQRE